MSIKVEKWHLLKHPFYRAWEDGSLPKEALKEYARQYFHHVSAFPRYLSSMHSQIEDIKVRQIILENLVDEEQGEENHPKLWSDFCKSLGLTQKDLENSEQSQAIRDAMNTFFSLARKSPAAGLGALYAYESQIPEIAEFKLEALKKFYVDSNQHSLLKFFEIHRVADQYHRSALEKVFMTMSPEEKEEAQMAAELAAKTLWKFLDHMNEIAMAA